VLRKDDKIQKKTFPYELPVEMETRANGQVVARCPLLPGVRGQGRNAKEAMERLKTVIDLHLTTAAPAFFSVQEKFPDIPTLYALAEYKGALYAATGRDSVFRSSSGTPGSFKTVPVTRDQTKFFHPTADAEEGAGDLTTQIYCLCSYAPPGAEPSLFAGTNLNGSIFATQNGETWKEAFTTDEDRVHALTVFKNRLYAGTSSQGRVVAFDGLQWNTVGILTEVAVTCFGTFKNRLYAGTYPSGLIFSTQDGLNWEEVSATGQHFIQCFREYNGALYAGTSSPKGVKVYRTTNGRDWQAVYESGRELNLYCLEVFENTLYAGTGNTGRILKTQDGEHWATAYSCDEEGVRAFAVYNDYLYAGTENSGVLLRSTFDKAGIPDITELQVEKLTSSSALVTWTTDLTASSELFYGAAGEREELARSVADKSARLRHRFALTDLKAETEYSYKAVSANRTTSLAASETSSFTTPSVLPPEITSSSHAERGKWERTTQAEFLLHPSTPLVGYYYQVDSQPETIPAPPQAAYTEERRLILPVSDGVWYLHVVGVDEAENVGNRASHYRVQIDTKAAPPPVISSPSHPDKEKWISDPSPRVVWGEPEDLSGVKGYFIKADHDPQSVPGPGNGEFTTDTRFSLGPLDDGPWFIHVSTQDLAGNVGMEAAHLQVKIDTKTLPPSLSSHTHPQQEQWYPVNQVDILIQPPPDLSGVEGYYYLLDREPQTLPDPAMALYTLRPQLSFKDLADGIWYVHARTKDQAGNLSPHAAHFKICLDTLASPPQVASSTHGEAGRWYRNRRVEIQWEDPFDHSGIEGYYYNIDRKADTVPNDHNSLFTTQRSVSFEVTDDGLWYFHITTKDKAGNVDWKAVHFPVHVDSEVARPFITSETHPDPERWTANPKAQFKLTAPDDLSGVTGFYYLFSEDPKPVPDPSHANFTEKTEIAVDIPRDGVFTLAVVAQDAAGNVGKDPALYRVRLDTTTGSPEISSVTHSQPDKWYAARRVELVWKDPEDLSGIEGYYFLSNQEESWAPVLKEMAFTATRGTVLTMPGDGIWIVHVIAKDRAGNLGPCARFKVLVDSEAQAPMVKSPTHPLHQWVKANTAKMVWEAPRELSGIEGYYVSLDTQPHTIPGPNQGKWTTENSLTTPALKDGRYYFHLVAKDKVGNLSREAAHFEILIDSAPPRTRMKSLPKILDRTEVSLEWESVDDLSGIESYDVQSKAGENGAWTDFLTRVADRSATFNAKDGVRYAFRCRARDGAGNQEVWSDAEMASVTVDISPPPPVAQLKATPKAGGDIELKWTPVVDAISGTDYYRVYRWVEGGDRKKISMDGEVKGVTYLDPGEGLKDATAYYYCVQAVDRMGNEQHEGNQVVVCISDHGVGVPALSSPTHSGEEWSSNSLAVMMWDAPADVTGIAGYYTLLDQSPSSRPPLEEQAFTDVRRLELNDLQSGIWYFHVIAKDRAGNLSEESAHYRLKIDVEKPAPPQVVSLTHPDPECWYASSKIQFKLFAPVKLSGFDAFYYLFDQEPGTRPNPADAQRTTEEEIGMRAPSPGVWYLHATVRDKAGNLSEPAHAKVLTAAGEAPPPVISSPTHPREDEAVNQHHPVFRLEDRHDGSFKGSGVHYRFSANEVEKVTEEDPYTAEKTLEFKDIAEGTWYLHVAPALKKGKIGSLVAKRRIMIRRMGALSGMFLRKDGTTPVVGAKVEVIRAHRDGAVALTDAKGAFKFSDLPEGRYEVRLSSDQFPVLALRDIPVASSQDTFSSFIEDVGLFPNPTLPGPIRIYYFLKEDCNVMLEIYDSTGTLVDKVEEKKEGGAYAVSIWDAGKMPEGEYLYKLSAKSVLKNTVSRFGVKKFKLQKPPIPEAPVVLKV
jgi:predicted RNase H-like HicB family nuclease